MEDLDALIGKEREHILHGEGTRAENYTHKLCSAWESKETKKKNMYESMMLLAARHFKIRKKQCWCVARQE